jgi:hypothetical protein
MKTLNQLFSAFKGHGLFASFIAILVFPFVLLYTIFASILFPMITLIMAIFMFVSMVFSAYAPKFVNDFIDDLQYFADMSIKRLGEIPSFSKHFSHKKEDKMWIRSLNLGKDSKPLKGDRTSSEFKRFASIILWLFACKELRPFFFQFLARVERLIQSNGSTWTFKYLKECMRIIVRCLAGTPHMRGEVKGNWIFIRLDHYGLPCILPLKLREYIREYVRAMDYSESGTGFELKVQSEFHPNKWENAPLPYHTKKIVAILSLVGIFRVLKTSVEPSLSTIVAPFTGEYKTLPKDTIKEALTALTKEKTKGKGRFDFVTGTMKYQIVEKDNGRIQDIINIGRFHPHLSAKAGPNAPLSTWSAAIDALAFMHEPIKALKLIGWMIDQKAYTYVLWFISLNFFFGIPYIVWFYILKAESRFVALISGFSSLYYLYENTVGRFFSFWRVELHNSKGLVHDQLYLGKLGVVFDQAGKARVVASTNWWLQSAFHGLHDSLFKALKLIPSDGTFDQNEAFSRVLSKMDKTQKLSGFDLSAATDRLPIDLQEDILNLLGVDGTTWRELLDFEWFAPFEKEGPSMVRYAVGQPMGAYSSWAMLALTHHVIVFAAYKRAGVSFQTANYAVLGDDMIVNNDLVGTEYVALMKCLGLSISLGKSVISPRFTEFAKKLRGPDIDFTPVGAGAILAACRSGYMFPACIKASIGTAVTSTEDLLDLVKRVPAGLVARRDLSKFVNLVLWQFFGPSGKGQVLPAQFGSMLLEWVSGLPLVASMLVTHLSDSIGNVEMRRGRSGLKNSHMPMVTLLQALATVSVMRVPLFRVLETLMIFVNPGFWVYFKEAVMAPIKFWEKVEKFYENLPRRAERGYLEDLLILRYRVDNNPDLSIIEFPLTKAETKLRATYLSDVLKDMQRRHRLSEAHVLHQNWYELYAHYGESVNSRWPDLSDPNSTISSGPRPGKEKYSL